MKSRGAAVRPLRLILLPPRTFPWLDPALLSNCSEGEYLGEKLAFFRLTRGAQRRGSALCGARLYVRRVRPRHALASVAARLQEPAAPRRAPRRRPARAHDARRDGGAARLPLGRAAGGGAEPGLLHQPRRLLARGRGRLVEERHRPDRA